MSIIMISGRDENRSAYLQKLINGDRQEIRKILDSMGGNNSFNINGSEEKIKTVARQDNVFKELSITENIHLFAGFCSAQESKITSLIKLFDFESRLKQLYRKSDEKIQYKVLLLISLLPDVSLLIWEEPFSCLNMSEFEKIALFADQNKILIVISGKQDQMEKTRLNIKMVEIDEKNCPVN